MMIIRAAPAKPSPCEIPKRIPIDQDKKGARTIIIVSPQIIRISLTGFPRHIAEIIKTMISDTVTPKAASPIIKSYPPF